MKVEVQAYSGYKSSERPQRFFLNGREYVVEEVCDQWLGPDSSYFKVRASDHNLYILEYRPDSDEWRLASFRNSSTDG